MGLFEGKKVGVIECEKDEQGRLVCTFQELGKGEDAAVFTVVAAKGRDGVPELIQIKNQNKKPVDPDSLIEAEKFIWDKLAE